MCNTTPPNPAVRKLVAVDVFCGVGGLTAGLREAGIEVVLGIDSDPACGYAYSRNSGAMFLQNDVRKVHGVDLAKWYPAGSIRVLAGCAPCKPFSALKRNSEPASTEWNLLSEFARIVGELQPDMITMENVPRAASKQVFKDFVESLLEWGYTVRHGSVHCPRYGIPQKRRRLVLLASKIGDIKLPEATIANDGFSTVRKTIGALRPLHAGEADPGDPMHQARSLSKLNVRRLQASTPGGSWKQWPEALRSACHKKPSGKTYGSVYSRMEWDAPAPTITTQFFNFGTGRFGHPEQDRSLTPREAALIQTFPESFEFIRPGDKVNLTRLGRLIGNAVPPLLAYHIGKELVRTATAGERSC